MIYDGNEERDLVPPKANNSASGMEFSRPDKTDVDHVIFNVSKLLI